MKKLIIACAAVLVLGLGLTTVGHVLGGQFYSVYYNGALHPLTLTGCRITSKPAEMPSSTAICLSSRSIKSITST